EQRLPQEPMVLKPAHEIGKYGGTWRRAFTGPADGENVNRIMATDKMLHVDFTGIKIVPSVAKDWKLEDGGRTTTLFLRKGLKWSDGEPFTADDLMFWYEDLYSNKELTPTPAPEFAINGKPGKFEKIDDLEFGDRKSTRLNSSHDQISYAVFCLKKKKKKIYQRINKKRTNNKLTK